jgi:F0F1-type ATP synthase membrane subunit b/b'
MKQSYDAHKHKSMQEIEKARKDAQAYYEKAKQKWEQSKKSLLS